MPSRELLTAVLKDLVPTELQFADPECEELEVRLQVTDSDTGGFSLHFGDPQYDTDHRGYWGASHVTRDMPDDAYEIVAEELLEQTEEHYAQTQGV